MDYGINGLFYALGTADHVNPMSTGNQFGGQVDELRIWNSARSAAEITNNMNSRLLGTENNLVLYYRFDEGAGLSAADSSGHGLTGALLNGAAWVGSSAPFAGAASAPAATTLAASAITHSGATLNGTVNANGLPTLAWFEYGFPPRRGRRGASRCR